jgi:hypothetical protein
VTLSLPTGANFQLRAGKPQSRKRIIMCACSHLVIEYSEAQYSILILSSKLLTYACMHAEDAHESGSTLQLESV